MIIWKYYYYLYPPLKKYYKHFLNPTGWIFCNIIFLITRCRESNSPSENYLTYEYLTKLYFYKYLKINSFINQPRIKKVSILILLDYLFLFFIFKFLDIWSFSSQSLFYWITYSYSYSRRNINY